MPTSQPADYENLVASVSTRNVDGAKALDYCESVPSPTYDAPSSDKVVMPSAMLRCQALALLAAGLMWCQDLSRGEVPSKMMPSLIAPKLKFQQELLMWCQSAKDLQVPVQVSLIITMHLRN